ncbi:hypothetical protein [Micromonospora aurantiaca (nom. illeg.)]|uniref:hypothetical protein n=1 Tax=Micromonospora aurantiaca (nom. illeg.) TaxID=47850 RepID=UPI0033D9FA12
MFTAAGTELNVDHLVSVGRLVRRAGVTGVKLTGGDPALYDPLEVAVERLRAEAAFDEVEVISRHPRIGAARHASGFRRHRLTRRRCSTDALALLQVGTARATAGRQSQRQRFLPGR